MRRLLPLLLLALLVVLPSPAGAGGSWMDPARDRYEPGEVATVVGYTGGGWGGGWVAEGPYRAWLRATDLDATGPDGDYLDPGEAAGDVDLGEMDLQETGRGGGWALRLAVSFTVPDLPPGRYDVVYGGEGAPYLGDIVGGLVYVGVDPEHPIERWWPTDDPALAGAPAEALLPGAVPAGTAQDPTPPSTTTTPPTTTSTTTEPVVVAAPTTIPVRVATSPISESSGTPGWLLVALGAGVVTVTLAGAAVVRRRRA